MASIDRKPIPALRLRDPRLVGPGLAWSAVLAALYSKESWPTLAAALAQAKAGDGSLMLLISDPFRGRKPNGSYSNMQDAYTANTCLDYPAPTDVAMYTGWARRLDKTAPHFAQLVAYNDLICAFWPCRRRGRRMPSMRRARRRSSSSARPATRRRPTTGPRRWPTSSTRASWSPARARATPATWTAPASRRRSTRTCST